MIPQTGPADNTRSKIQTRKHQLKRKTVSKKLTKQYNNAEKELLNFFGSVKSDEHKSNYEKIINKLLQFGSQVLGLIGEKKYTPNLRWTQQKKSQQNMMLQVIATAYQFIQYVQIFAKKKTKNSMIQLAKFSQVKSNNPLIKSFLTYAQMLYQISVYLHQIAKIIGIQQVLIQQDTIVETDTTKAFIDHVEQKISLIQQKSDSVDAFIKSTQQQLKIVTDPKILVDAQNQMIKEITKSNHLSDIQKQFIQNPLPIITSSALVLYRKKITFCKQLSDFLRNVNTIPRMFKQSPNSINRKAFNKLTQYSMILAQKTILYDNLAALTNGILASSVNALPQADKNKAILPFIKNQNDQKNYFSGAYHNFYTQNIFNLKTDFNFSYHTTGHDAVDLAESLQGLKVHFNQRLNAIQASNSDVKMELYKLSNLGGMAVKTIAQQVYKNFGTVIEDLEQLKIKLSHHMIDQRQKNKEADNFVVNKIVQQIKNNNVQNYRQQAAIISSCNQIVDFFSNKINTSQQQVKNSVNNIKNILNQNFKDNNKYLSQISKTGILTNAKILQIAQSANAEIKNVNSGITQLQNMMKINTMANNQDFKVLKDHTTVKFQEVTDNLQQIKELVKNVGKQVSVSNKQLLDTGLQKIKTAFQQSLKNQQRSLSSKLDIMKLQTSIQKLSQEQKKSIANQNKNQLQKMQSLIQKLHQNSNNMIVQQLNASQLKSGNMVKQVVQQGLLSIASATQLRVQQLKDLLNGTPEKFAQFIEQNNDRLKYYLQQCFEKMSQASDQQRLHNFKQIENIYTALSLIQKQMMARGQKQSTQISNILSVLNNMHPSFKNIQTVLYRTTQKLSSQIFQMHNNIQGGVNVITQAINMFKNQNNQTSQQINNNLNKFQKIYTGDVKNIKSMLNLIQQNYQQTSQNIFKQNMNQMQSLQSIRQSLENGVHVDQQDIQRLQQSYVSRTQRIQSGLQTIYRQVNTGMQNINNNMNNNNARLMNGMQNINGNINDTKGQVLQLKNKMTLGLQYINDNTNFSRDQIRNDIHNMNQKLSYGMQNMYNNVNQSRQQNANFYRNTNENMQRNRQQSNSNFRYLNQNVEKSRNQSSDNFRSTNTNINNLRNQQNRGFNQLDNSVNSMRNQNNRNYGRIQTQFSSVHRNMNNVNQNVYDVGHNVNKVRSDIINSANQQQRTTIESVNNLNRTLNINHNDTYNQTQKSKRQVREKLDQLEQQNTKQLKKAQQKIVSTIKQSHKQMYEKMQKQSSQAQQKTKKIEMRMLQLVTALNVQFDLQIDNNGSNISSQLLKIRGKKLTSQISEKIMEFKEQTSSGTGNKSSNIKASQFLSKLKMVEQQLSKTKDLLQETRKEKIETQNKLYSYESEQSQLKQLNQQYKKAQRQLKRQNSRLLKASQLAQTSQQQKRMIIIQKQRIQKQKQKLKNQLQQKMQNEKKQIKRRQQLIIAQKKAQSQLEISKVKAQNLQTTNKQIQIQKKRIKQQLDETVLKKNQQQRQMQKNLNQSKLSIQKLKQAVKSKIQTITKLQTQISSKDQQLKKMSHLQKQLLTKKLQQQALRLERDKAKQQLLITKNSIDTSKNQITQLKSLIQSMRQEKLVLQKQKLQMIANKTRMVSQQMQQKKNAQKFALQQKINNLNSKLRESQQQCQNLQKNVSTKSTQLEENSKKIIKLNNQISNLSMKIQQMTLTIASLEGQLSSFKQKQKLYNQQKIKLNKLNQSNLNDRQKIAELQRQIDNNQSMIAKQQKLQKQNQQITKQLNNTKNSTQQLIKQVAQLSQKNKSIASLLQKQQLLNQKLKVMQTKNTQNQTMIQQRNSKITSISAQFQKQKKLNQQYKTKLTRMKQLQNSQVQVEKLKKNIQTMQENIKQLSKNKSNNQAQLQLARKNNQQLTLNLQKAQSQLKNQLANKSQDAKEHQQAINKLKQQNKTKKNQLLNLFSKLSITISQIDFKQKKTVNLSVNKQKIDKLIIQTVQNIQALNEVNDGSSNITQSLHKLNVTLDNLMSQRTIIQQQKQSTAAQIQQLKINQAAQATEYTQYKTRMQLQLIQRQNQKKTIQQKVDILQSKISKLQQDQTTHKNQIQSLKKTKKQFQQKILDIVQKNQQITKNQKQIQRLKMQNQTYFTQLQIYKKKYQENMFIVDQKEAIDKKYKDRLQLNRYLRINQSKVRLKYNQIMSLLQQQLKDGQIKYKKLIQKLQTQYTQQNRQALQNHAILYMKHIDSTKQSIKQLVLQQAAANQRDGLYVKPQGANTNNNPNKSMNKTVTRKRFQADQTQEQDVRIKKAVAIKNNPNDQTVLSDVGNLSHLHVSKIQMYSDFQDLGTSETQQLVQLQKQKAHKNYAFVGGQLISLKYKNIIEVLLKLIIHLLSMMKNVYFIMKKSMEKFKQVEKMTDLTPNQVNICDLLIKFTVNVQNYIKAASMQGFTEDVYRKLTDLTLLHQQSKQHYSQINRLAAQIS